MARILIIDSRGARSADFSTSKERFDLENKKVFGEDLDINEHTPANQIAGINALVATEMAEEFVRSALYGSSISYAPGTFLDSLGSLLDIRREQASKSRIDARLSGVAGTVIPAGRLAKNKDGDLFESESPVTIRDGGTVVGFIATEEGPKDVSIGTLSEIVSVISGWERITNDTAGILGRDKESDASYRATIRSRTAHSSIGSIAALESALRSAGATRIRILENTSANDATKAGVLMPGHSILVIADGGVIDDLARAIENHKGMGVGTYTVSEGNDVNIAEAQKIINGRLRFNGTTISGFNFNGQNLNGIVERINDATTLATFTHTNGRILTLHSWSTDDTGFEDISGNVTNSNILFPRYTPVSAKALPDLVFVELPSPLRSTSGIGATVKFTSSGTETTPSNGTLSTNGRTLLIPLTTDIASNATNINVTISTPKSEYQDEDAITEYPVSLESTAALTAPPLPVVYGEPIDGGVRISAYSIGTVTQWQYRRFQSGSYRDSTWQSLSSSVVDGVRMVRNQSITGYTNGAPARIDVRAQNSPHGNTAAQGFAFIPSTTSPTLQDAHIDGKLVTLTYNAELKPLIDTSPSAAAWGIGGNTGPQVNITKLNVVGTQAYLTLSAATAEGDAWNITNTTGLTALNGATTATFSSRVMSNDTIAGIPSAPINVLARRTAGGWKANWEANHDGGLAEDRYEVSTLPQGSSVWTDWISTGSTSTTYSALTTAPPEVVRVRASNPNSRSASTLGLISEFAVTPFTRSIVRRLIVSVTIYRDSSITTDDFDAVKNKLVDLVNSYDIGSRLWQADLQAAVESIPTIRLSTSLTVTSGGLNVDGDEQTAYNRWSLSPDDITITFQN